MYELLDVANKYIEFGFEVITTSLIVVSHAHYTGRATEPILNKVLYHYIIQ